MSSTDDNVDTGTTEFIAELDRTINAVKLKLLNQHSLPTTSTPELIEHALASLPQTVPSQGIGLHDTTTLLLDKVCPALAPGQTGPRWFGLVTGGVNPASHIADNLVTLYDPNVQIHNSKETISTSLEQLTLNWLIDMLNLNRHEFTNNSFTTGATASNVLALTLGRESVVNKIKKFQGQDDWSVAQDGFGSTLVQVLVSGAHASVMKAASLVGIGRKNVRDVTQQGSICDFDLKQLEAILKTNQQTSTGSIVVVSAGEVNTGGWTSNVDKIATLCKLYDAWLHIDAAFGAFAILSKKFEHVAKDLSFADSITGDAHKCNNVPYDCGFLFSKTNTLYKVCGPGLNAPAYLESSTSSSASFPHLDEYTNMKSPLFLGIENSKRFRALPVFASLISLGTRGYKHMVESNLKFAETITHWLRQHEGYQVLLPVDESFVQMNIVLFKASTHAPDRFQGTQGNSLLIKLINETRQVYCTGTTWRGQGAIRFAISNWSTRLDRDWPIVRDVLDRVMR
ncbi:hypothetical protein OIO90_003901 [Microbotryomycetes sp. JL221]|nr:hypothetical protein OIO90_003901 [Microbotryomycetes sp. JL221]